MFLPARHRWMLPLTLALAGFGCTPPPKVGGLAQVQDAALNRNALQLLNYEQGRHQATGIERAADSILALSTDPSIRRNALLWKTTGIPLAQEASLQTDPLMAAVDLWGFSLQQQEYFSSGPGSSAFGPHQPIAVAAAARLESDARISASRIKKDGVIPPQFAAKVQEWAHDHPLSGPSLARATVVTLDWGQVTSADVNVFGSVANMEQTLNGVSNRLGYLNEGLIKQMTWNAELMTQEAAGGHRVDSLLNALTLTLASVQALTSGTPALLDTQRAAVFSELSRQRVALLSEVDRERLGTLQALTGERVAVLHALSFERDTLLQALRQERIATLLAADSLVQRAIDHTGAVVGRLIWQVTLMLAGLIALGVLGGLVLWKGVKRGAATS